ncbi:MAG: radical SAM protein [Bacillota bacterium]
MSIGTAAVLGLTDARLDVPPTTAYLLTNGGCLSTCAFCPQARSSVSSRDLLSRVSWPEFPLDDALAALAAYAGRQWGSPLGPAAEFGSDLRSGEFVGPVLVRGKPGGLLEYPKDHAPPGGGLVRVCVQVTKNPGARKALASIVSRLSEIRRSGRIRFAISVSHHPSSLAEVEDVFSHGADRMGIPLDGATPAVYAKTKSGSWEAAMALLERAARGFPGRISSHIIVGLGETEKDAVEAIQRLADQGITVGLFAFTPVKGTPMENVPQPGIGVYRRVQMARHIIANGLARASDFSYGEGRIRGFGLDRDRLLEIASTGEPFRTSGCPGCNRPYYNERPGGTMYNYPRPLTTAEIRRAIVEAGFGDGTK